MNRESLADDRLVTRPLFSAPRAKGPPSQRLQSRIRYAKRLL